MRSEGSHGAPAYTSVTSQPNMLSAGPIVTHPQSRQSHQSGEFTTHGANNLPPSNLGFFDADSGSQGTSSGNYGNLGISRYQNDPQQYNNFSAGPNGQTYLSSQPPQYQYSTSNAPLTPTHFPSQPLTYASVAGISVVPIQHQPPARESMQQQARAVFNQKPSPKRNRQPQQ